MDSDRLYFGNTQEWREWLSQNHDKETEAWLVIQKKRSSKAGIRYDEALDEGSLFKPKLSPNVIQSHLKYPILIPDKKKHSNCVTELKREGFMINYCYKTLHSSPFFNLADNVNSASFKEATYVSEHVLPLPIETNMSDQTIAKVVSIVNANLHN